MKVTAAEFYKSFFSLEALPAPNLPEIAFAGRSNVGKSSLINKLLNRRGIAKTSSTPGRTQSINFILANRDCYLVDLPGYGYAKVPRAVKKSWGQLIQGYLQQRSSLKLLILIVDSRRMPNEEEKLFAQWLDLHEIPWCLVLTKTDKLKNAARARARRDWQNFLDADNVVEFSAVSGLS